MSRSVTDPVQRTLPPTLRQLAGQLEGELVVPGDPNYDWLRLVHNGLHRRHPAAIAMCVSTADVVASVKAGRASGLPVAVRTTGHHMSGFASVDDGLIIDLSRLRGVSLDLENRLATVRPGTRNSDLDRATFPEGFMCPTGTCEDVAVGGAHLMGGWSFLSTTRGFACDSIVELEVVTADGEVLIANERENPDLFWAMRGAGWNFGIATRLTYKMYPIPRKVYGGLLLYDVDDLAGTLRGLQAFWDGAPNEVVYEIMIIPAPQDQIERGRSGPFEVRLETVYVGEFEEGVKALAPLFDIAPVKDDNLRAMDFPNINLTSGIGTRGGARHHWTTQHIPAFNEDIINVIVKKAEELRETQAAIRAGSSAEDSRHRIYADHIYFYPYKGEMCRIPEDFNAYGRRDPGWIAQILVAWGEDDERIEERVAWGDAYRDELEPFSYRNGYLNSTIYTGVEQVKLAYGDAKFRKLQRLKAKYDPDNFFNRNFNIPPDANA